MTASHIVTHAMKQNDHIISYIVKPIVVAEKANNQRHSKVFQTHSSSNTNIKTSEGILHLAQIERSTSANNMIVKHHRFNRRNCQSLIP